jgi:hypothetical protein
VGSEWVNVAGGGAGQGNAMFDVQGSRNVLHISNVRTLGDQLLKVGSGGNHIIDVNNLFADGITPGNTDKIVQSDSTTNEARISGYHSVVGASSFSGRVGAANYTNGNLGDYQEPWAAPSLQIAGLILAGEIRRPATGRIALAESG